jgi:hypothetical protein
LDRHFNKRRSVVRHFRISVTVVTFGRKYGTTGIPPNVPVKTGTIHGGLSRNDEKTAKPFIPISRKPSRCIGVDIRHRDVAPKDNKVGTTGVNPWGLHWRKYEKNEAFTGYHPWHPPLFRRNPAEALPSYALLASEGYPHLFTG